MKYKLIKENFDKSMKALMLTEEIYTVKSGDIVSQIAKRYGTTVGDMIRANPALEAEQGHLIDVGQELIIPVKTYGDIETVPERPSRRAPEGRPGPSVSLGRDEYVKMTTPSGHVAMTSDTAVPSSRQPVSAPASFTWQTKIANASTPAEVRKISDQLLQGAEERYGIGSPQMKSITSKVRSAKATKLSQLAGTGSRRSDRLAKRASRISGEKDPIG